MLLSSFASKLHLTKNNSFAGNLQVKLKTRVTLLKLRNSMKKLSSIPMRLMMRKLMLNNIILNATLESLELQLEWEIFNEVSTLQTSLMIKI